MAQKTPDQASWLRAGVLRLTRVHFLFILAYVVTIILFDAWNLITPQIITTRWTIAGIVLVVNALIWYGARTNSKSTAYYKVLIITQLLFDIGLAGVSVYIQRGIASRSVFLFAIPLIVAAILHSKTALFATAIMCAAAYSTAVVRYFYIHPGEGYKVELYGELAFHCTLFFIVAAMLWAIVKTRKS